MYVWAWKGHNRQFHRANSRKSGSPFDVRIVFSSQGASYHHGPCSGLAQFNDPDIHDNSASLRRQATFGWIPWPSNGTECCAFLEDRRLQNSLAYDIPTACDKLPLMSRSVFLCFLASCVKTSSNNLLYSSLSLNSSLTFTLPQLTVNHHTLPTSLTFIHNNLSSN